MSVVGDTSGLYVLLARHEDRPPRDLHPKLACSSGPVTRQDPYRCALSIRARSAIGVGLAVLRTNLRFAALACRRNRPCV